MNTPIAPLLRRFFHDWLEGMRRMSGNTIASYETSFQLLLGFARQRLGIEPSALFVEQLDSTLITQFLEHIEVERGNSVSTRKARLAAIKSFFKFLEHQLPSAVDQARQVRAIPTKKGDQRLVVHLTGPEVKALIAVPDPSEYLGIRDLAIILILTGSGLRVSELVALRLEDIQFDPTPVIRVMGKGRRERVMPLTPSAAKALRAWLAARGTGGSEIVFLNHRGAPISRFGVRDILKRRSEAAQRQCASLAQKRVHPHVLRHTTAMQVLAATKDPRLVATYLGHASMVTTEVYIRADVTEKLETVDKLLPASLRRGRFTAPRRLYGILHSPAGEQARNYVKTAPPR
jgi:integrase/recombinase XerD